MCMIDNGDGMVTMIAETRPKARKQHKCAECRRQLDAGENYVRERLKFDGDLTNHRTCVHCEVVRKWLQDECGGFLFGGIRDDIEEHAAETSTYGLGVARLAIGMRWKWRGKRGLLRIPSVPQTTKERLATQERANG